MLLKSGEVAEEVSEDQRMENFSYAYGVSYDSYLINDGNRKTFLSKSGDGLLGYIQDGKFIHVIGGLLASSSVAKIDLLQTFLQATDQWGIKTVLFHNIVEEDLPLFKGLGVEATKCGEEAIIDLPHTDWKGGAYEWVRRQEHFCRRKGLVAEEVTTCLNSEVIEHPFRAELESISDDHVKRTITGKEFSYFAGRLNLTDLKRKRVFVARSEDRIEAFIVCNPGQGGEFYAIEMYRYRQEAPRGAMPFLWMHALRQMKCEGVSTVSLCMMPFYNCGEKHPWDNVFLRYCNNFWFEHLNWLFNAKGLQLFKSRFRPKGRPMYTVAYPKTSIGGLWSAFQLWELSSVLTPSALMHRLGRAILASVRKCKSTKG